MTARRRWVLLVGVGLVGIVGFYCFRKARTTAPPVATVAPLAPVRPVTPSYATVRPYQPAFTLEQFRQFLTDARRAEAIADPLQRCLAYPDPPGLNWSKAVTEAYCHYQLDALIEPDEVRRLIQSGQVAELDRRCAQILHAQLTQPGSQSALDRSFNIDFAVASPATRALLDAWKRQSPQSPYALAASGLSYVAMAQAARGSEYAAKTSPEQFASMERLLQQARTDLDAAAKLDPRVMPAYEGMLYVAMLTSDGAYAINAAKHGLAFDPADYPIYARLAWMSQPKWGGSVPQVQGVVAAAQRHAKDNPLLLLLLSERKGGDAYVEDCSCSWEQENDIYQHLFAEAGTVGMLMSGAEEARKSGSRQLELIYLSEVLRFDPGKLLSRQARVYALSGVGQYEWALAEGNALVAMAPQDENSYEARGLAYEDAGQRARAVQDFEQALRVNPDDSWGLMHLGNIYAFMLHDWNKAWTLANRMVQVHPDDPQGWLLRAKIEQGQPRKGLEQTISEFVARFGSDPSQQEYVQEMQALRPAAPTATVR